VLKAGDTLGPYTIEGSLGAGTMGTVYRGRDPRLNRTVAIKVMADDGSLLSHRERFRHEAMAVGALNHPNICAIYDVGEHDGSSFLVMEFIDGETLADRLVRSAFPLLEGIEFCRQLAATLDCAHRAGIVHRDLKPANIMLAKGGLKLLDFGLATLKSPAPMDARTEMMAASGPTSAGMIVGTVPYMAPEVLEGAKADGRSDIFSLGAIIFETLTRRRAFPGDAATTVIAQILTVTPPAISGLIQGGSVLLDRAVRRCLEKRPENRWQNAGDLAMELAEWNSSEILQARRQPRAGSARKAGLIAAALSAAVLIGWLAVRQASRADAAPQSVRFRVPAPEGTTFTPSEAGRAGAQLAVSPDGNRIAFVATSATGTKQLWIQTLDAATADAVPNTEGATFPFWAPDGASLGFFAHGKLARVAAGGGNFQVICDAPIGLGGTWNRDGVIVFAGMFGRPLSRVAASGGEPTPVTVLSQERHETDQAWPQFLPDGRHFIFGARSLQRQQTGVYVGDLESKTVKRLVSSEGRSLLVGDRFLSWHAGRLLSQRLDPATLELTGTPELVAEDVARGLFVRYTSAAGGGGTLVYQPAAKTMSQLTWVDRTGEHGEPVGDPGQFFNIALSPDEHTAAVSLIATPSYDRDIWSIDLVRNTLSRLTTDPGDDFLPVWSPDGTQLTYVSDRSGVTDIYRRAASGIGTDELLFTSPAAKFTSDWSFDNRFILFDAIGSATRFDVWSYALDAHSASPVIRTPFMEYQAKLSRDGQWITFVSEDTGKPEVYVRRFPVTDERWQISTRGGTQPMWRDDGRELFYLDTTGALMSVAVSAAARFTVDLPRKLFDTGIATLTGNADANQYAVARHGERFLINRSPSVAPLTPLVVVTQRNGRD
jgi:Tol biopolymer transport system component/predicted Ser/Thr protein kinase